MRNTLIIRDKCTLPVLVNNTKKLTRIDWNIAVRLLTVLYESGKIKKTTISRDSKMSYNRCIQYLDWFELLGFIKKEVDEERFEIFYLTDLGITFCRTKLNREQKSILNLEHLLV